MKVIEFTCRCGGHGNITEHSTNNVVVEMVVGGATYSRHFLSVTGAKLALDSIDDSFRFKEVA